MAGIAPRLAWLPGKVRGVPVWLPSQLLYAVGWFCAQLVWVVRDDLVRATVRLVDGRRRSVTDGRQECVAFVEDRMTGIAPRLAWLPGEVRRSSSRLRSPLLYAVGWFCAQLVWVVRADLVGNYGPLGGRETAVV